MRNSVIHHKLLSIFQKLKDYVKYHTDVIIVSTLILFFVLLMISSYFKPVIILEHHKDSSLQYFSSGGIEALASVLAIVVSVTMMSVQLSSQEYTHWITKSYTKSFIFVSLFLVYIPTLLFNIYMLNQIEHLPVEDAIKGLNISILAFVLCFVLLLPYVFFSINQIRPDYIISRKLRDVNKRYIESNRKKDMPLDPNSDHVLPVAIIIEKAIKSNDRSIIAFGLDEMYNYYSKIITKENFSFLSNLFLYHLSNIGNTAVINSDSDTIKKISGIYVKIAKLHESKDLRCPKLMQQLSNFGIKCSKDEELEDATLKVLKGFTYCCFGQVRSNTKEKTEEALLNDFGVFVDCCYGISQLCTIAIQNTRINTILEGVGGLIKLAQKSDLEEAKNKAITTATKILLEATNKELDVMSASKQLGEYIGEEVTRGKMNLRELENERYYKFTLQKDTDDEIILQIKECYLITLASEIGINEICKKTRSHGKTGFKEFPICWITYRYLTNAIQKIKKSKSIRIESIDWDEKGNHILTFTLKYQ